MKLKIELKSLGFFDSVLCINYWEVRETQSRRMRCQAEYFDLKLDWTTQLWNGVHASKYSAHHSRSSVLLILRSYPIPTIINYPGLIRYWWWERSHKCGCLTQWHIQQVPFKRYYGQKQGWNYANSFSESSSKLQID